MAALEIFVKLTGIDGDSTAQDHPREIVVLSYEQSIDATLYHGGSGGTGVGKTTFHGVRFRKSVDAASVPILLACATGQRIAQARFAFRRAGAAFDFYEATLDDVLVTHVAQRAGTGAQYPLSFDTLIAGAASDGFVDEVTLDFARIRWRHRSPGHHGALVDATGGFDARANHDL